MDRVPDFIAPMLLTAGAPPRSSSWVLEPKWDGCRAQLRVVDGVHTLRTRHSRDITAAFPELAAITDALPARVVLDGELICVDRRDGLPDFDLLRSRLVMSRPMAIAAAARERPALLVVFDLLHLDATSTCSLALRDRRDLLERLQLTGPAWDTTPTSSASDHALVAATRQLGLEGVVAKRLDAPYLPGRRSRSMLKHKHRRRSRLVLSGWQPGRDTEPASFLLRYPDGRPAGRVARAIAPRVRAQLQALVTAAETGRSRGGIRDLHAGMVLVDVDHHGRTGGTVRDPAIVATLPGPARTPARPPDRAPSFPDG